MSLYYFSAKMIRKSTQSAVASASYRSGEKLFSERDMELKSYGKREVLPESFILAPSHAPEWVYNRERLWNEVELIENRWNSQLAREVLVALPVEIENEEQTKMLKQFVQDNFVSNGMVADVSIHRDKEHNPHAHIMLTVRPFKEDGSWGQKQKRKYLKDENGEPIIGENGKKKFVPINTTNWNDKETFLSWRKNYAEIVNEWYLKHEISEKVSHESYEKQGLDKLPHYRLTRKEYAIERKEIERSSLEGKEYKPVTTYGNINKEIDVKNENIKVLKEEIRKTDDEINRLKDKVVSLSDYRKSFENDKLNELNKIRKSFNLSDADWKAIKVVANRLNGFVDLKSSRDNLVKLDNWNKKIEHQKRMLNAEESVLLKARNTYEKEPSKTLLFGLIPNKFRENFNEKVLSLKEKQNKLNETEIAFAELLSQSKRVNQIQTEFVNEEFKFLYPKYAEMYSENNEKVLDIKAKYVELFRQDGTMKNSIVELDTNRFKLTNDYARLDSLLNEWKQVKSSLFILEKTKEKRKDEYTNEYRNFDEKKVYDSFVRYTESQQQISSKESEKDNLETKLFNEMKQRYSYASDELIRDIPANIQVKVFNLHLEGNNTGLLSEDLSLIKKEQHKNKDYNKENEYNKSKKFEDEFIQEELSSKQASEIVDSLMNMVQAQETKDHDLEAKRQSNKKNKLYRQLGELEL